MDGIYLGVDIGATKTLILAASESGDILRGIKILTREEPGDHVEALTTAVEQLVTLVATVWKGTEVKGEAVKDAGAGGANLNLRCIKGIGICCPGPVDPVRGIVVSPPNLPCWRDFPLVEILKDRYGCPVKMENDADAAGLAEYHYGAGRGSKLMVYMTVSTGVGSGIIRDGEIVRGANGAHPELGHHVVDPSGPMCSCGCRGCLEAFISGSSIKRNYGISPEEAADPAIWGEVGRWLGIGLGNVAAAIVPEVIVIGGGVAKAGERLLGPAREYLNNSLHMVSIPRVVLAELGDLIGGIGALAIIMGPGIKVDVTRSVDIITM
ncbi:MAG TPA: ROK family protein [Firmicutes bacterium]|nr:ROK family protein [Bacillota bacterium]